jgi:hypothetical protein
MKYPMSFVLVGAVGALAVVTAAQTPVSVPTKPIRGAE